MELKHTNYTNLSLSLPNLSPSSIHSCLFKPWIYPKISSKKHFEGLDSVHEIKGRAQSLNSILRQCGVCIDFIAASNKNGMDVDLLLKYQLLNTLAFAPAADNQLIKRTGFSSVHQVGLGSSVGIFDENSEEKPLTMLTAHGLPHAKAKSAGYFLVLVPLIAFCITSIVGAFRTTRVRKDKGGDALDESRRHKDRPKSTRWKHALSYSSETDNVVTESAPEDENGDLFEDAYGKVENDYQKFLSECGISQCRYGRGGINQ